MTLIPILTFFAAVLVAVGFEWLYAFLERRWILPESKEIWATAYWAAVCIIAGTSGIIPFNSPGFMSWMPFFFVMVIHIFLSTEHGFLRQPEDADELTLGKGTTVGTNNQGQKKGTTSQEVKHERKQTR